MPIVFDERFFDVQIRSSVSQVNLNNGRFLAYQENGSYDITCRSAPLDEMFRVIVCVIDDYFEEGAGI